MVTNRARKKSFDWRRKNPEVAHTTATVEVFDPRSWISGPTSRRASACPNLHEWWTQPAAREMPGCSAINLAEIWRSSKISSRIWSIISGVVIVLGRPRRGASQLEKSPRLNWATQFLMAAYDGACSPDVCQNGVNFLRRLALKGKKNWQLASLCCWNRARRLTCFLSDSVTRKGLQFGTWKDPSFLH